VECISIEFPEQAGLKALEVCFFIDFMGPMGDYMGIVPVSDFSWFN
jgi:hypothetical protein